MTKICIVKKGRGNENATCKIALFVFIKGKAKEIVDLFVYLDMKPPSTWTVKGRNTSQIT